MSKNYLFILFKMKHKLLKNIFVFPSYEIKHYTIHAFLINVRTFKTFENTTNFWICNLIFLTNYRTYNKREENSYRVQLFQYGFMQNQNTDVFLFPQHVFTNKLMVTQCECRRRYTESLRKCLLFTRIV